MKSKIFATVFLSLTMAVFSGQAIARTSVPIVNRMDNAVATASGKAPSADQVKQAIIAGAAVRNWTITQQPDGNLQGTLVVRGKHTAIVLINYDTAKYSISYKDSVNLNYGNHVGQPVIHPYYNGWVEELNQAIRVELGKL